MTVTSFGYEIVVLLNWVDDASRLAVYKTQTRLQDRLCVFLCYRLSGNHSDYRKTERLTLTNYANVAVIR